MQKQVQIGRKPDPKFEAIEQKIHYFKDKDTRLYRIWKAILERLEEDQRKLKRT
jgi:hypothetical protein